MHWLLLQAGCLQDTNSCEFERWKEWKHLTSQEVKLKICVEMEAIRKGSLRQPQHAAEELCRRQELTELVIDSTELQQLAQRFQFPEPADHQHLRSGKLDEVETHTRGKKVDDKAMHKGLAPSLQHPALVLGSSLQLQLDWNKDYWRLLPECRSRQQNKDSSTVDKKKDGQGRAGSKEQDPEAAPITSVYQGGRWNNQSCSIDPLAPTHSMPQLQGVTARVLAADQAADQLLAEKD